MTNSNNGNGTDPAALIVGDSGDDTLTGAAGADTIIGDAGADQITGGDGEDLIVAGSGDDQINSDGIDTINAGSGTDTVDFSGRAEGIVVDLDVNSAGGAGTPGQDGGVLTVPPAAGGTVLFEIDDVENIIGTDFNDGLFGNNEANILNGGDGDDVFHSFGGADTVIGGADIDTILFNAGPGTTLDLDDNGDGTASVGDVVTGIENITGSASGDDNLSGNNQRNLLNGNGGNDFLNGEAGFDTLNGGAGDDTLEGGAQADLLNGDAGNDVINGGSGADRILGGANNDLLSGGTSSDILLGGLGNDTLNGDEDNDVLTGNGGFDQLNGGSGDDTLNGGAQADALRGDDGDDVLNGEVGNDLLFGGNDNDILNGGESNDFLFGQNGDDQLSGGGNADFFVFEDGFGNDTIVDFAVTNTIEVINLSAVTAFSDFADVASNLSSDLDGNAVITDGSNSITLLGVNASDLTASDFIF